MPVPDPGDARLAKRRRVSRMAGHVQVWLGLWGLLFTTFAWFGARRAPHGAHGDGPAATIALLFVGASRLSMAGGVAAARGWRPAPLWHLLALPLLVLLTFLLVSLRQGAPR